MKRLAVMVAIGLAPLLVIAVLMTDAGGPAAANSNQQSCVPPPGGLVSWWTGDGNADDIWDGNDGTLQNGATFAPGKVGQAFSLDGADDLVEIPDSATLDTGTQFTIDAWFKTDNVHKVDPGTGQAAQSIVMYGFDDIDGKNNVLMLRSFKLFVSVRGGTAEFEDLFGTTTLASSTWYHVALTYDGTTARLYLNGVQEDSKVVTMNLDANSRVLIGRYQSPSTFGYFFAFDGLIDEVEIFDRALSASEIAAIFGAGSAGKCKAIEVDIDIKPGSDPNSINTRSRGRIPVAILSTADFDAPSEVDKASVTFGRTGDEDSLAKCTKSAEDVNADGLLDQVCHFKTQATGFQAGDTEGILKGQTVDGLPIEGRDSARIVH